ncbi:tetratricopeptide repeat protein [Orientia tsutsugamushi]|uniref:tetratricopeptide repeat protein n=1 Tax=Orientia tsutsugamushi TaxID=784 RepID=UPI000301C32D
MQLKKNKLIQQNSIKDENVLAKEYSNIGSSFLRLKKYQEAIKIFDLAIKYRSDNPEAYYNRGTVLMKLGYIQEDIENYDIALLGTDQITQKLIIIKG